MSIKNYLEDRFPFTIQLILAITYLCIQVVYSYNTEVAFASWVALTGLASFILLFFQLRLVDDIDDFIPPGDGGDHFTKNSMIAAWSTSLILLILLNVHAPITLTVVLLASLLPFTSTLILKNILTIDKKSTELSTGNRLSDLLLGLLFEGGHFCIMYYAYSAWSSNTGAVHSTKMVLLTTLGMWCLFGFWKYSRFLERPNWDPYNIPWNGFRHILVACCLLTGISWMTLFHLNEMPLGFHFIFVITIVSSVFYIYTTEPIMSKVKNASNLFRSQVGTIFALIIQTVVLTAFLAGKTLSS